MAAFGEKFGKLGNVKNDHLNTMIGEGSSLKGSVKAAGGVRIDGRLEGNLTTPGKLSVGASGEVVSDKISAQAAIIGGRVRGDLVAPELVKLEGTADFTGTITTRVLIVQQGARLNGSASMQKKDDEK